MLNNEMIRNELIRLSNDLNGIRDGVDLLLYHYDELISLMRNHVVVDDKIIRESDIMLCKKQLNDITKDISNGIIPRINNIL